ncbi:hypothetical protein IAR50_001723 [Cryptococcus sp. DSM 104548]
MLATRNHPTPADQPRPYTHIPSPRSSIAPSRTSMDSNITHVPFSIREREVFYDPIGNGEKVSRGSSLLRTLSRSRKDKGFKVERNERMVREKGSLKDDLSVEGSRERKGSLVRRLKKRLSMTKESTALVSNKRHDKEESEFGDKEEMILLDQAGDELSYHPESERSMRQNKPLPDTSFTSSPPPKRSPTWRKNLASSILGPTSHSAPRPLPKPPSRSPSPFSKEEAKPWPSAKAPRDPFASPPKGRGVEESVSQKTRPLRVQSRSAGKREVGELSSPPNRTRNARHTPQPFNQDRFLTAEQILSLPLPSHTPQGLPSRYRPSGTTIFDIYPDEDFDYHPQSSNPFESLSTSARTNEAYSLYDISHYTAEKSSFAQPRGYHGQDDSVDWSNVHEVLLNPSPLSSARSSVENARLEGGHGDVKQARMVPLKYEKPRRSNTVTSTRSNVSTSSKGSILGFMGPIMM